MENKKWEYETFGLIAPEKDIPNWLNEKGQDGWELVAVESSYLYIFKRPIINNP